MHVFSTEEVITLRRFDGKKALVARAKNVNVAKAWVSVISTSITRVEGIIFLPLSKGGVPKDIWECERFQER